MYLIAKWALLILLVGALNASAQSHLDICDEIIEVPLLKSDKIPNYVESYFTQYNVLEKIELSKARFELRLYQYDSNIAYQKAMILEINGSDVIISEHMVFSADNKDAQGQYGFQMKSFKGHGVKDSLFIFYKMGRTLKNNCVKIKGVLKILMENHLFDVPGEDNSLKLVDKKYPLLPALTTSTMIVELKVNSQFRKFYFRTMFDPEPTDIPEIRNKAKLLSAFNTIFKY